MILKTKEKISRKAMRTTTDPSEKSQVGLAGSFPERSSEMSPKNLHTVGSPCQSILRQAFQMHHTL